MDSNQSTKDKDAKKGKTYEAFKMTSDWVIQAKRLKENFSQLADVDLKLEVGKEDELLTKIETLLKKTREEVLHIIQEGQLAAKETQPAWLRNI